MVLHGAQIKWAVSIGAPTRYDWFIFILTQLKIAQTTTKEQVTVEISTE